MTSRAAALAALAIETLTVSCVALFTVTLVAATPAPEKITLVPAAKPEPLITTAPVEPGPLALGEMLDTFGPGLTVKQEAQAIASPSVFVTVTFGGPSA